MAENVESLAIQIDLNANPVIQALNRIADTFNNISAQAQYAGQASDEAFSAERYSQSASAMSYFTQTADTATDSLHKTASAGLAIGKATQQGASVAQQAMQQLDGVTNRVMRAIRRRLAPLALYAMGKRMIGGYLAEVEQLSDISKEAKIGISDLDAWRRANVAAGGSADAFSKAMLDYTKRTGKSGEDFIKLGSRLNDLSEAQQEAMLKQMGLTRESAAVFMQGNKEMQELVTQYRSMALTPQDAENARKFRMQWTITKGEIHNIATMIAGMFMPALMVAVQKFKEGAQFIRQHSDFIKLALGGIATAALLAFGPKSVLATLRFIATPVGAVIAAILLLAAVLDDLIGFTKGYNSAFEEMLKKTGMTKEEIENIRNVFKQFGKSIGEIADACGPAIKSLMSLVGPAILQGLELVLSGVGAIVSGLASLLSGSDEAADAFAKMSHIFVTKFQEAYEDVKQGIRNALSAMFDFVVEWLGKACSAIKNAFLEAWHSICNAFLENVLKPILRWIYDKITGPFRIIAKAMGFDFSFGSSDETGGKGNIYNQSTERGGDTYDSHDTTNITVNGVKDGAEGAEKVSEAQQKTQRKANHSNRSSK